MCLFVCTQVALCQRGRGLCNPEYHGATDNCCPMLVASGDTYWLLYLGHLRNIKGYVHITLMWSYFETLLKSQCLKTISVSTL